MAMAFIDDLVQSCGNTFTNFKDISDLYDQITTTSHADGTPEGLFLNLTDKGGHVFVRTINNTAEEWSSSSGIEDYGPFGSYELYPRGSRLSFVTIVRLSKIRTRESSDIGNLSQFFLHIRDVSMSLDQAMKAQGHNAPRNAHFVLIAKYDEGVDGFEFYSDQGLQYRIRALFSLLLISLKRRGSLAELYAYNGGLLNKVGSGSKKESDSAGENALDPHDTFRRVLPTILVSSGGMAFQEGSYLPLGDLQSSGVALSKSELEAAFAAERGRMPSRAKGPDFHSRIREMVLSQIRILSKSISGTARRHLKTEEKNRIRREIAQVMVDDLSSSNVLAQLLYVYMLGFAVKEKGFQRLAEGDPGEIARLHNTAFDSLSFSEGVYQLVENSCMHTEAGFALLSINCHDLRNGRDKYLSQEELRGDFVRRRLEEKYGTGIRSWSMAPGYWIEIRVFDLALRKNPSHRRPYSGGDFGLTPFGMVENYNSNASVDTYEGFDDRHPIESMLQSRFEASRMRDVLVHYGLRMLGKIVYAGGGAMMIRTPHRVQADSSSHSAVWKSVSSGREDNITELREERRRFSEVSVVLPALRRDVHLHGNSAGTFQASSLYDASQLDVPYAQRLISLDVSYDFDKTGFPRASMSLSGKGVPDARFGLDENPDLSFDDGVFPSISDQKVEIARRLSRGIYRYIKKMDAAFRGEKNSIFLIDYRGNGLGAIEVAAKALYGAMMREAFENSSVDGTKPKVRRFAIFFSTRSDAAHSLRIASIFYTCEMKFGGGFRETPFQIYICCPSKPTTATMRQSSSSSTFGPSFGSALKGEVLPEVCFVLTEGNVEQAEKTAEVFCYHHAAASLEMAPFISYLCHDPFSGGEASERESEKFKPIIPVDAYLTAEISDEDGRLVPNDEGPSWLLRRLSKVVNSGAGHGYPGCKRTDVHVHVGVKVHIPSFFDCTALFQNVGLVKKLAYIVAAAIVRDYSKRRGPNHVETVKDDLIYVYGYEGYSSLLVREVVNLVKARLDGVEVGTLTYTCSTDSVSGIDRNLRASGLNESLPCLVYPIVPIATTGSTAYKMLDRLEACCVQEELRSFYGMKVYRDGISEKESNEAQIKRAEEVLGIVKNLTICSAESTIIILVASESTSKRQQEIRERYWRRDDDAGEKDPFGFVRIFLTPASREERDGRSGSARYCVTAETEWMDPFDKLNSCEYCTPTSFTAERALLSADKTGTVAKVSFPEYLVKEGVSREEGSFSPHRFLLLFGCVDYGHFWDGDDHSQYYIDIRELKKKCTSDGEYAEWLLEQRELLERGTYNVLIAPIEPVESGFYNDVINRIFESSIRVIHVHLDEASVDDIRARYSSVVQDLRYLHGEGRGDSIRFYYAQPCIRSGRTLRKAEAVVRMFCFFSGIGQGGVRFLGKNASTPEEPTFAKAFCLVDQTIPFVAGSSKVVGFIRLNAPAMGVKSLPCPICETIERLRLTANRCADDEIANELQKSAEHLKKMSVSEAREYGRRALRNPGSLRWLIEWARYVVKKPKNTREEEATTSKKVRSVPILAWKDVISGKERKYVIKTANWICDECLPKAELTSIEDLDRRYDTWLQSSSATKAPNVIRPSEVFSSYVIAQRNLMRLYCEDELGRAFGMDQPGAQGLLKGDDEREMSREALVLFLNRLDGAVRGAENDYLRKEWILSYLKTMSRGRMLQAHHTRQAVMTCSLCMADLLCRGEEQRRRFGLGGLDKRELSAHLGEETKSWETEKTNWIVTEESANIMRGLVVAIVFMEDSFRFRILEALVNRLGDLGSSYLLDPLRLRMLYSSLKSMSGKMGGERLAGASDTPPESRYEEGAGVCKSAVDTLRLATTKSIISATDGSRSFLSRKLLEDDGWREGGDDAPDEDALSQELRDPIEKLVVLGMSPMLYNGIERMWNIWNTVPVRESLIALYHSDDKSLLAGNSAMGDEKAEAIVATFEELQDKWPGVFRAGIDVGLTPRSGAELFASFLDRNRHTIYSMCAERMIDMLLQKADVKDSGKTLWMNPFSRFFSLIMAMSESSSIVPDKSSQNAWDNGMSRVLSSMLLLFKYVMDLSGRAHVVIGHEDRPYVYEGICACVRDLFFAEQCFAVYVEDGDPRILMGSPVKAATLVETTAADGWGELSSLERKVLNTVKLVHQGESAKDKAVISLKPRGADGSAARGEVYFVCTVKDGVLDDASASRSLLLCKRDVLFLRNKLSRVLHADLAQLLEFGKDYSSVPKLTPWSEKYRVLHLSDLHISANSRTGPSPRSRFVSALDISKGWKGAPSGLVNDYDLVLITGDVAQADNSPHNQKKNYQKAGEFVRMLAASLWRDISGCVRWDWTKRVAIITGNHDYTSSSGFEPVKFELSRTSEVAKPSRSAVEAPAKFIYFYGFLHHVLRADLGDLWANELNEERNYDRLGLSLVMLNSSALVGPIRTNKVGFSKLRMSGQELVSHINVENDVVIMTHHAPVDRFEYVTDEYYDEALIDARGKANPLSAYAYGVVRYLRSVKSGMPPADGFVKPPMPTRIVDVGDEWISRWCEKQFGGCENGGKIDPEYEGKCLRKFSDAREDSVLFRLCERANQLMNDGDYGDEELAHTAFLISRFKLMGESDAREYGQLLTALLSELSARRKRIGAAMPAVSTIILCGHTHIGMKFVFGDVDVKVLGRLEDSIPVAKKGNDPAGFLCSNLKVASVDDKQLADMMVKCGVVRFGVLERTTDPNECMDYSFEGILPDFEEKLKGDTGRPGLETMNPVTIKIVKEGYDSGGSGSIRSKWQFRSEDWQISGGESQAGSSLAAPSPVVAIGEGSGGY